jgi:hypothetical protein
VWVWIQLNKQTEKKHRIAILKAHPGAMEAHPGAMEAHPSDKAHYGTVAPPGALQAQPGALHTQWVTMVRSAMEGHPGAKEAHTGAV